MSKRKTRRQKENARHPFLISWKPKENFEPSPVKREIENAYLGLGTNTSRKDLTNYSGNSTSLASVRKDLLKSLFLASLIFALEIVLYFAWSG